MTSPLPDSVLQDLKTRLQGKTLAVTGGSGFIGTYFMALARAIGVEPLVLEGNVGQAETFLGTFDILFHFAACLPSGFREDGESANATNVAGVIYALEACRRNTAKIVFPSTAGVYAPSPKAVSESHPLGPSAPYTQSKFAGETLCQFFANHHGIKASVLRLFNVYGSHQKNSLVPYILGCLRDQTGAIIKSPNSVRDFVHGADVAEAAVLAALEEEPFALYNVGGGVPVSVNELIAMAENVSASKLSRRNHTSFEDPHLTSLADISLIKEKLGWVPRTSLEDGLRQAYAKN